MKRCYIVGGGNFYKDAFRPDENSLIIAADAGYRALCEIGITPDIVVGDFDSLGYTKPRCTPLSKTIQTPCLPC